MVQAPALRSGASTARLDPNDVEPPDLLIDGLVGALSTPRVQSGKLNRSRSGVSIAVRDPFTDSYMINLLACPACGAATGDLRAIIRKDVHQGGGTSLSTRLVDCGCGHVFINPQPTWEELSPFYQSDYHVFADPLPDAASVDRLLACKHHGERLNHALVVPGGKYLDVGCGLGQMVAAMARLGMEAEGVEPGQAAVERARAIGLKIHVGMLHDAQFPDARFDSLSLYHVLEHTLDPVAVLTECRRILSPTGEILVGVPNFESYVRSLVGSTWTAYDLPRHVQHFCQSSISRVAARAGLTITAMETESLPEHVELELAKWLRRRLKVPARLTLKTGATRRFAAHLAKKGTASGRGESLIVYLRPDARRQGVNPPAITSMRH
jgi:ubiquinone/menaquinone biosynthesis C-methylase UbiE